MPAKVCGASGFDVSGSGIDVVGAERRRQEVLRSDDDDDDVKASERVVSLSNIKMTEIVHQIRNDEPDCDVIFFR
jgi:hypothetical protein